MNNIYAILDKDGGWLINRVIWNGDLSTWQPPEGTVAVPDDQVDYNNLPQNPEKNPEN